MAKSTPAPEPVEPDQDLQAEIVENAQEQTAAQQPQPAQQEENVQVFPSAPAVQEVQFAPISGAQDTKHNHSLDLILNVEVQATVELGRANMRVKHVLELGPGSVVELEKLAGEPVDVLVNNRPFARGEVVVIDECFGVRVTEIITPTERIASLG